MEKKKAGKVKETAIKGYNILARSVKILVITYYLSNYTNYSTLSTNKLYCNIY